MVYGREMVPLQVIILALVVMLYADNGPAMGAARADGGYAAGWIVAAVLGSHFMLVAIVARWTRGAKRLVHQPTSDAHSVAFRMERLLSFTRWATVLLAALQIWGLGWGALVWRGPPGGWGRIGQFLLLPEMILFAPAVLTWLGLWIAAYGVEKALKERSFAYRLALGLPAHDMPSLGRYVSMQLRHNFFLLVPMVVATAVERALAASGEEKGWWGNAAVVGSLALMLLGVPWLITRIWSTEPMRGALRERLDGVARRHRVRFRNVLIWKTHHHVSNAAILGYLPFARYFLLSDALLESLTDRQIEAVFAHEVGHGRHRHVWWYGTLFVGAMLLATMAAEALTRGLEQTGWAWVTAHGEDLRAGLSVLGIGLFVVWGFGWVSRRFEHQADWFAAQEMAESLTREPEAAVGGMEAEGGVTIEEYMAGMNTPVVVGAGLGGNEATAGGRAPLTREERLGKGVEIFGAALIQIVELAHRSLQKGGWMHPSVYRRVELLEALARSEKEAHRFERRMLWIRVMIAGVLAAGLAGMALGWKF